MPSRIEKRTLSSQEGRFKASASSTIEDGIHTAVRVLQGTNYWASMPGVPQAVYTLLSP